MTKLLTRFQEDPSVKNAQKILDYARKHPMAVCMLDSEQHEMFNHAQVVVSNS